MRRDRCKHLEKGRARAFTQNNGAQVNLAFYRDGDFFGELSILNGSPRAAPVEAYSDCDVLALNPDAVRSLKQSYPEFGKLLEERLAQYKAKTEARIPSILLRNWFRPKRWRTTKSRLDGKFAVMERRTRRRPLPTTRDISGKRSAASANSSTSRRSMKWTAVRPVWA